MTTLSRNIGIAMAIICIVGCVMGCTYCAAVLATYLARRLAVGINCRAAGFRNYYRYLHGYPKGEKV